MLGNSESGQNWKSGWCIHFCLIGKIAREVEFLLKLEILDDGEIVQSFGIGRNASLIGFLCKHLLGIKSREEGLLLKQHVLGDKEIEIYLWIGSIAILIEFLLL